MRGLVIEWVTVKAFHEEFFTDSGKVHNVSCMGTFLRLRCYYVPTYMYNREGTLIIGREH